MVEPVVTDRFEWSVRVYFEDTDAGGIVYYANYLKYMERARTEWLRAMGMDVEKLARDARILFTVRSIRLDYMRPARLSDALCASVALQHLGGASIELGQAVTRDREALCAGEVRLACVDADSMRPRRIPVTVARAISSGSIN